MHNYNAMKYYFAPLEGITGYIYRQAHHAFYPGMDRYYAPFIVPKEKKYLNTKECNDLMPDHNKGMNLIPQIMTNKSEEFLRIAALLYQEYGYRQINLNLGCPSKTVVSKKRGSGFLSEPDQLKLFLDEVCNGLESYGIVLSVKTRIGKDGPEEFPYLLEIFEQFPLAELIVHPRIQADFYHNTPNLSALSKAYKSSMHANWELCYNGDIFNVVDYGKIYQEYPQISAVMMGRGLLINPRLSEELKVREFGGNENKGLQKLSYQRFLNDKKEKEERKRRYDFHKRLLEDYTTVLSGEKDVLFKMKELWFYMSQDFTEPHQYWKKMKKAQKLSVFECAVDALYQEQRLLSQDDKKECVPVFLQE